MEFGVLFFILTHFSAMIFSKKVVFNLLSTLETRKVISFHVPLTNQYWVNCGCLRSSLAGNLQLSRRRSFDVIFTNTRNVCKHKVVLHSYVRLDVVPC